MTEYGAPVRYRLRGCVYLVEAVVRRSFDMVEWLKRSASSEFESFASSYSDVLAFPGFSEDVSELVGLMLCYLNVGSRQDHAVYVQGRRR